MTDGLNQQNTDPDEPVRQRRSMTITIVGLGPGSADDITRRVWTAIERAQTVVLRTGQHPCAPSLPISGQRITCDDLYETHAIFDEVHTASYSV
ncbi:MAG: hypothetical protein HND48_06215 [Chloroflexi bacterium]|nr:hypothetical protein [Chloroflexota bacterium]